MGKGKKDMAKTTAVEPKYVVTEDLGLSDILQKHGFTPSFIVGGRTFEQPVKHYYITTRTAILDKIRDAKLKITVRNEDGIAVQKRMIMHTDQRLCENLEGTDTVEQTKKNYTELEEILKNSPVPRDNVRPVTGTILRTPEEE